MMKLSLDGEQKNEKAILFSDSPFFDPVASAPLNASAEALNDSFIAHRKWTRM